MFLSCKCCFGVCYVFLGKLSWANTVGRLTNLHPQFFLLDSLPVLFRYSSFSSIKGNPNCNKSINLRFPVLYLQWPNQIERKDIFPCWGKSFSLFYKSQIDQACCSSCFLQSSCDHETQGKDKGKRIMDKGWPNTKTERHVSLLTSLNCYINLRNCPLFSFYVTWYISSCLQTIFFQMKASWVICHLLLTHNRVGYVLIRAWAKVIYTKSMRGDSCFDATLAGTLLSSGTPS